VISSQNSVSRRASLLVDSDIVDIAVLAQTRFRIAATHAALSRCYAARRRASRGSGNGGMLGKIKYLAAQAYQRL